MTLPKEPALLMSLLNTLLRDEYASLGELCEDRDLDPGALSGALRAAGLSYDADTNRIS